MRCERSGVTAGKSLLLGSRWVAAALGGLQQTRLTRGVETSGKPLGVISALVPRPARRGRSRRQALCLCVTSIEPSGDNGNMALNGAGEDLSCGVRGCGVREATCFGDSTRSLVPFFPQKSTISPGSLRPKRKRRCCKLGGSGRIASPRSWAITCCVATACWATRARTVG